MVCCVPDSGNLETSGAEEVIQDRSAAANVSNDSLQADCMDHKNTYLFQ